MSVIANVLNRQHRSLEDIVVTPPPSSTAELPPDTILPQQLDSQVLPPIDAPLNRAQPADCIALHVERYHDDSKCEVFKIRLMGKGDPILAEPRAWPPFNLEDVFQKSLKAEKSPGKKTWNKITAYSRGDNELMKIWRALQPLRRNPPWYLLLHDHTPNAFPWEMLRFDEECYLGVEFNIVRQLEIARFQENKTTPTSLCRHGNVLAYLLRSLTDQTGEADFFRDTLKARIDSSIQAVQNWLTQADNDCALLYMACHGMYEDDDLLLGCDEEQLSYLELDNYALPGINGSVVFINACHSAREQDLQVYNDGYLRSFPELFLSKGAHGVISTLVSVSNLYAAQIARDLLQKNLRPDAQPLSVLLRELRAEAQSRLKLGVSDQDYLWVLNVFCYTYYGHPQISLSLGSAP